MFFYGEYTTPTIIANKTGSQNYNNNFNFDLRDAKPDDVLFVYHFRATTDTYNTQYAFISSSGTPNWYSSPDTKAGIVNLYGIGGIIQTYINCAGTSQGTFTGAQFGSTGIIIKRLTAQDLSGVVRFSCLQGGTSGVHYMILRGVNSYDMYKNASGSIVTWNINPIVGTSTGVNWPIANSNITNKTEKLFILGLEYNGTGITTPYSTNISKDTRSGYNYLHEITKTYLTGSSIPVSATRSTSNAAYLYNSNTNYAPFVCFIGAVIS